MVLVIYKIQVRGDTVDSAVKRNRYEIDMCNGTVLDKTSLWWEDLPEVRHWQQLDQQLL